MGRPWKGGRAWTVIEQAEDALGEPLSELVLDAPAERLGRTRDAQLAVLLTSLVAWDAARDDLLAGHDVVAYAGHSLGQVTALIASGVLDVADGVRFAVQRAEATQRAADAHPGRMAALLGATPEQADAACDGIDCWVANDNAPGQIVVAGTPDGVDAAAARAKDLGVKRVTPLKVGGAFHTSLMADAQTTLRDALADVALHEPAAPIVSNADATAYTDGEAWRERLVVHPTVPVRWRASMETLARAGDDGLAATHFAEIGHGSMIAGVAKRTVPAVTVINIATPDDLSMIQELR
jgi:[acyl-carrier-protein] S-malonyltransferase